VVASQTLQGCDPPTITCLDDCPVACASDIRPGTPEFTVSCDGTGTLTVSDPEINGDPGCDGTTYTYTYTVTDECGRTASCDQVFTMWQNSILRSGIHYSQRMLLGGFRF